MTGSEIRKAREAAGVSQDELARALGINQTMLSRIEQDKRTPDPQVSAAVPSVLLSIQSERTKRLLATVTGGH